MINICKQCNIEFNTSHKKQIFCTRKCTDTSRIGIKQSKETCIKKSISHTGKKREPFTKEHIENLKKSLTGLKRPPFTQEHKDKIGAKNKGKVRSEDTKDILSEYFTGRPNYNNRGEKSGQWKGGITPVHLSIRSSLEYKLWRKEIFERDNYTCQECNIRGGTLNVDHYPVTFSAILNKLIVEQGLENLLEKAKKYEMFWMTENGRTLCEGCHRKTPTFAKNITNIKTI